ncbi:PepSY domain-containing protein [Streptomyces erythrochromogenes]|uniref:PepSY domain-containing protein n=1 Tax=Streptomyces erythrochromogenes TaxID=285574 RepID=A0ABZ1QA16_9ACTN|nr:PepSY domain-containing protein [Streptomyces erythrochromogenes]
MKRTRYVSAATAVVLMTGGPVAVATAAAADPARTAAAAPVAARADVTAESAAAAALKHYPGVIESLDKDGSVWHVDVIGKDGKGHAELEVSASGSVTGQNRDTDENAAENKALVSAKVTAQQAMKAALAAHPGQVTTVEWDDDDGTASWHVEVKGKDGKTWDAQVDPTTGKVTQSGSDADSDDDGDGDGDGNN